MIVICDFCDNFFLRRNAGNFQSQRRHMLRTYKNKKLFEKWLNGIIITIWIHQPAVIPWIIQLKSLKFQSIDQIVWEHFRLTRLPIHFCRIDISMYSHGAWLEIYVRNTVGNSYLQSNRIDLQSEPMANENSCSRVWWYTYKL